MYLAEVGKGRPMGRSKVQAEMEGSPDKFPFHHYKLHPVDMTPEVA